MDVDTMMTSSAQDQMEMMTMMMQLDRLPEIFGPYYSAISQSPETEFSGRSVAAIESSNTPIFHNPSATSTTLIKPPPPSLPTMATPFQEPMTTLPPAPKFRITPSPGDHLSAACSLQKRNSMEAMREMIFRIAVMQPIHIDPESVKPPKRRNVKISKDPQSVAARHRRERISERIRILQRLVPGGTKMDTASMLDEAIHYVKFLKKQVQSLEQASGKTQMGATGFPTTAMLPNLNYSSLVKPCQTSRMLGSTQIFR
ncbi:hypothetical protein U1Q18_011872 [Sarracenia purpurea var. burkii]